MVSTPSQLDSDDEPLMATDVAPPMRSEVLEAFDFTMAGSDTSESSRAGQRTTGEVRKVPSNWEALWQCGHLHRVCIAVDLQRYLMMTPNGTARMPRTRSPARRRRRLRITWQEDVVHDSCMDRTVRGAEALIHDLAQRIGNTGWGSHSGCDPAAEVVAIECCSRGQSVHPFDRLVGFKGFISGRTD